MKKADQVKLLMFLLGALIAFAGTSFAAEPWSAENACSGSEKWNLVGLDASILKEFQATINGKSSSARGFSEAMALRRQADSHLGKILAEYWAARAFYGAQMPAVAASGFAAIVNQPITAEAQGVQTAALECWLNLNDQTPSASLPRGIEEQLSAFPKGRTRDRAAVVLIKEKIRTGAAIKGLEAVDALITPTSGYRALADVLVKSQARAFDAAVSAADAFFAAKDLGSDQARYGETVSMLAARAAYSARKFDQSVAYYQKVGKRSNEIAHALQEMAWAYLLQGKYGEAIGTGVNLSSGGLRRTFAPESPMVAAMAFNELCQYPDSLRAIETLRKNYETTFQWLTKWDSDPASMGDLYTLAIQVLRKQAQVPDRVATEWLRSPHFISRQEEINLFAAEGRMVGQVGESSAKEQKKNALGVIQHARAIKEKILELRKKGETQLGDGLKTEIASLKDEVIHYQRMKRAALYWRKILAFQDKRAQVRTAQLKKEIHQDLSRTNKRMLGQLEEVAENTKLIEVEILQGASQDLIFRNAHPDFAEKAKKFKAEGERAIASKVWNWGKVSDSLSGVYEIWEDELGGFRADLPNNCQNQERFLALRQ